MSNPFYNQQQYEENPFNDPAVTSQAGTMHSAAPTVPSVVPSVASYGSQAPGVNPFYNQKPESGATVPSVPGYGEVAPAVGAPPPYVAGGAVPSAAAPAPDAIDGSDKPLSKKAKELKEKEKELKQKEKELAAREAAGMDPNLVKNWPPCFPILHHDLNEIPVESRRVVRQGLYSYYGLLICLTWNLIAVIAAIGAAGINVWAVLLAILYMVLGVPLAWFLWYRRLYFGAKKDKSIPFAWFFVFYLLHIAFCIYASLAPPVFIGGGSSFAGAITTSKIFDKNKVVGIMYIVGTACWMLESLLSIYVWQWSLRHFRGDRLKSEGMSAAVNMAASTQMSRV